MAAYKESGGPINISMWEEMFAQINVIEIELEKEPNEIKDYIVITKLRNEHIRCPWMFIVMLRNVTKRAMAVKITEMYLRRKKCILMLGRSKWILMNIVVSDINDKSAVAGFIWKWSTDTKLKKKVTKRNWKFQQSKTPEKYPWIFKQILIYMRAMAAYWREA